MPTMPCPDCGREISLIAAACPQCGRPIVRPERATNGFFRALSFGFVVALLTLGSAVAIGLFGRLSELITAVRSIPR